MYKVHVFVDSIKSLKVLHRLKSGADIQQSRCPFEKLKHLFYLFRATSDSNKCYKLFESISIWLYMYNVCVSYIHLLFGL